MIKLTLIYLLKDKKQKRNNNKSNKTRIMQNSKMVVMGELSKLYFSLSNNFYIRTLNDFRTHLKFHIIKLFAVVKIFFHGLVCLLSEETSIDKIFFFPLKLYLYLLIELLY